MIDCKVEGWRAADSQHCLPSHGGKGLLVVAAVIGGVNPPLLDLPYRAVVRMTLLARACQEALHHPGASSTVHGFLISPF
jgi:hypothetical protein